MSDTKESAWLVDVHALTNPQYAGQPRAFECGPRPVVGSLLSALAATGDRIAYFSGRYSQEMFESIDEWLADNMFPDGVLYLADPDEFRIWDEIEDDLLAQLDGRFEIRGRIEDCMGDIIIIEP